MTTHKAQIVTLTLWRFDSLAAKLWMFGQMGLARSAISSMPGLQFVKMVGTGAGAGFSTTPNFSRYGLFGGWPNKESAQLALGNSTAIKRLSERACETVTLFLQPTQSRGLWSGVEPFHVGTEIEPKGPIVALTRATLPLDKFAGEWCRVVVRDAMGRQAWTNPLWLN